MRPYLFLPIVLTIIGCQVARGGEFSREAIESFEKDVRPVLADKCLKCHGLEKIEAKLSLTSRAGVLRGGENGPAAIVAKPNDSLLIKAIRYSDELQMPPDGRLNDAQVATLVRWVEQGLPWPDEAEEPIGKATGRDLSIITEQQRQHWSFRPLKKISSPLVHDGKRSPSAIDSFILSELEKQGLKPSPPATKPTLLWRVTFDLTGLPPSSEELREFLADESADAFSRVVDRLLASPRYGEKWGRHWLDVARYADSSGKDENHACSNAFRYRDYVVQSLNSDKPYDRFVQQQLAGDLLPATSDEERYENLIATGFLQLGPKALAEQDKPKLLMDITDEQIDTVGKALLGLTVSCGRCHDHKLEPIPQRDYYALAGIFHSTRTMEDLAFVSKWLETPLASKEQLQAAAAHQQQVEQIEKELKDKAGGDAEALAALTRRRDELKAAAPAEIAMTMAVSEGEPNDVGINIRGNHLNVGAKVPRGFLQIVPTLDIEQIPAGHSGRLQLARWLTHPDHPLTSRVIVNRVWLWHFGQGLVPTPDNLGISGASPTHPELLDYLTAKFVADGWSLKQLHREILVSTTYQASCGHDEQAESLDPQNQLRWRFDRRRLTAEEMRDAWLAVSGQLDEQLGGNLFNYVNREPHVTYYKGPVKYEFNRRSIYLPVIRNAMLDLFDLFDHGDALSTLGKRDETTVPTQSLYLLNSEIVLRAAERVANMVLQPDHSQSQRISRTYEIVLNRAVEAKELAAAELLLKQLETQSAEQQTDVAQRERLVWLAFCQSLLISNEFLTVE